MVEKICRNCDYFDTEGILGEEWGFCIKPQTCVIGTDGKRYGDFKCHTNECSDFKQKPQKAVVAQE